MLEVEAKYAGKKSDFVTVTRAGRCVECSGRHVVEKSTADGRLTEESPYVLSRSK